MPGKPHSPLLHQQKPYVTQVRNGKALDKFGNIVDAKDPAAHIPVEDFIYFDSLCEANVEEVVHELKLIGIRLVGLLIITPFIGYMGLVAVEKSEKEWKSGNRRKRWVVMCGVFFVIAVIGGWLR